MPNQNPGATFLWFLVKLSGFIVGGCVLLALLIKR